MIPQELNGENNVSNQINGNNNIQVNGNYTVNKYEVINTIELSDFRAFEKVLFSIAPDRFLEDVVQPYLNKVMPGKTVADFKMMLP